MTSSREVHPPKTWSVLDTIAVHRCLDENGEIQMWITCDMEKHPADLLGPLEWALVRIRSIAEHDHFDAPWMIAVYYEDDDEEEEE